MLLQCIMPRFHRPRNTNLSGRVHPAVLARIREGAERDRARRAERLANSAAPQAYQQADNLMLMAFCILILFRVFMHGGAINQDKSLSPNSELLDEISKECIDCEKLILRCKYKNLDDQITEVEKWIDSEPKPIIKISDNLLDKLCKLYDDYMSKSKSKSKSYSTPNSKTNSNSKTKFKKSGGRKSRVRK